MAASTVFSTDIFHFLRRRALLIALAALSLLGLPAPAQVAAGYQVIVNPENSFGYFVTDANNVALLDVGLGGWGPKWGWVPAPVSHDMATGDHLSLTSPFPINEKNGDVITMSLDASATPKNAVTYKYTLTATKDIPLTAVVASIMATEKAKATGVTLTTNGTDVTEAYPTGRQDSVPNVSKAVFHLASGDITLDINPPTPIAYQSTGFRLMLAADTFKTGTTAISVTYTFAKPAVFIATQDRMAKFIETPAGSDWFAFDASDASTATSVFAMDDWLDKPAGKHGGVRMVGDHFQFEDGTPVKFWGTNLAYAASAPDHAVADAAAAKFARYGVNALRLHKFTGAMGWEGIGDPNDTTKLDPKGLEKFDYFTAQVASRGIYFGFSHTFNMRVRPGNKGQVLAYDEIMNAPDLKGNTMGLINYAPDLQDLLIQSVVNLLQHKNPYSGKTYAEDPALCYIELQNEDDIFWYNTEAVYEKDCPTYSKALRARFSDWLKQKYGTQEALAKAWGDALDGSQFTSPQVTGKETLEAKNINAMVNPYKYGEQFLSQQNAGGKQRAIDMALFLHDVQNDYYSRFVKAIRDAGYKGPICGSPWQAPPMIPHYLNLRSDYLAGFIDRHNYYGDDNVSDTMLGNPGSGYLSTGLQQVVDRPFGISEWITNFPLMYQADGPVMFAAYGMGLQGWDESYEFQSGTQYQDGAWFEPTAGGMPFGRWVVDSPSQLGQFPALARMIYRGDVHQGDVISTRSVSMQEISTDSFSFNDQAKQNGDIKTFGGSCPPAALAAGRCVVQFTDTPQPTVLPDMTKYQKGTVITSNTGQLTWDTADKGFFTINTDGTKAVVGFAKGKTQKLGNVTITSQTPYASIILTALDKGATLATAKSALLSVVARAESTGFTYNVLNDQMLNPGKAPLLLEPVQADIAISGRTIAAVNVLSQTGERTDKTVPVSNGSFHVNSANDKTLYYEVVFK